MSYRGHVRNGVVVLDEPVTLPEGALLNIVVTDEEKKPEELGVTLGEQLAPLAGSAKGLPADAAANHDSYLHGQIRK